MESNQLKKALETKNFVYTLELVPGRGAQGKVVRETMILAEKAIRGKRARKAAP